jgi:hypothetical protein
MTNTVDRTAGADTSIRPFNIDVPRPTWTTCATG